MIWYVAGYVHYDQSHLYGYLSVATCSKTDQYNYQIPFYKDTIQEH